VSAAELPPPLPIPWTMKPVESAETSTEHLPDGRMRWSIVHDIVHDVTPQMLVWWFKHMDGDVEIAGASINRYRAWHPRDHVAVTYVRKADDGSNMGPGSQMRIQEYFARNPDYRVDIVDDVIRLDEGGFVHIHHAAGIEVARMEYTFERTPGGTRYRNCLIAGMTAPVLRAPFNAIVRPWLLSDEMGHAWLTHNVEEVGNLEHFLPALFEAHA
jgi:hypothetical protein